MNELARNLHAYLFYRGEPIERRELTKIFNVTEELIEVTLQELADVVQHQGIVLVTNGPMVELRTHPDASRLIESIRKEEFATDLSKAALETLAIITYTPGITKSEIDYIRGVNSQFILRNLTIRGLVDRYPNSEDKRSPLYRPTTEFMGLLGISKEDQLPEYGALLEKLQEASAQAKAEHQTSPL